MIEAASVQLALVGSAVLFELHLSWQILENVLYAFALFLNYVGISSASVIELTWTTMALLGVVLGRWHAREARLDLESVLHTANDGESVGQRIIARWNLRTERSRLAKQLAFFIVGMLMCLTPPRLLVNPMGLITQTALGVMFLGLESLLVYDSLADRYDRRKLLYIMGIAERVAQGTPS